MERASILVVDDEQPAADTICELLTEEGFQASASYDGKAALDVLSHTAVDIAIVDLRMPHMDGMELLDEIKRRFPEVLVIMITAYATVGTAVEAMKRGAYDYVTKPFKIDELTLVVKRAWEQCQLKAENRTLRQQLDERFGLENVIGVSPKMVEVYKIVRKIAPTEATVLIRGESGTGKELIARAIHHNSLRRERRFMAVDCGALPRDLLESELFGHVRGAFTGAVATKYGLFEAAHAGTVFLDEISNAPQDIQVKLLRVLQEREIRRIGDTQPIKVDVRMIAATNQSLESLMRSGAFREDLYYRLNVVSIEIPPLRERLEDIPLLAEHFLHHYAQANRRNVHRISEEALQMLQSYAWPGNVRELQHVMERAVILCSSDVITPEDLPERVQGVTPTAQSEDSLTAQVEGFERRLIEEALQRNGGNQYRTARDLKISRQSLQYKLRKYGLTGRSQTPPPD